VTEWLRGPACAIDLLPNQPKRVLQTGAAQDVDSFGVINATADLSPVCTVEAERDYQSDRQKMMAASSHRCIGGGAADSGLGAR
jgi:hypothetical protein